MTRRKFAELGVDRAIWVVDVRQSLYFQQIIKILELWGFEQARHAHHLGYEFVRLPEGIISSRKGNVPVYDDIRDAVLARAERSSRRRIRVCRRSKKTRSRGTLPSARSSSRCWHATTTRS